MKYKIRNLVTNVFGWVTLILVVFFFFTMWLFNYNGVEQPLQSAWSLSVSILSGLATLAAAYIASRLFNDWKLEQKYHNSIRTSELLKNVSDRYVESLQNYIESVWTLRFNNEKIMENILLHNNLRLNERNLKIAIHDCESALSGTVTLDFDALRSIIVEIDEALRQIHPLSINTEKNIVVVDSIYCDENTELHALKHKYDTFFIENIILNINRYLLEAALL